MEKSNGRALDNKEKREFETLSSIWEEEGKDWVAISRKKVKTCKNALGECQRRNANYFGKGRKHL